MITENKPKNKFCSKMAVNCGVLFIALAVLLLIGCGAKDDSPVDHSFDTGTKTVETAASDKNTAETAASDKNIAETATSGTTDSEIITTDAEDSGTITEAAEDIKELIGLTIPTPVGEITYPEEESEKVTIECVSANGRLSYRFFSEVQGEKILLFEFFFGSEGVGYQIGSAPDNTGNMAGYKHHRPA